MSTDGGLPAELHAWIDGEHVATFVQVGDKTELHYDSPPVPSLSLSLPVEGGWSTKAPERWLENLLPENPVIRQQLVARYGARSASTLELLQHAGADVAGATALLPAGREPGDGHDTSHAVSEEQVRAAIASVREDRGLTEAVQGSRMSLAGAQAKFSLTRVGGRWWTPSASLPSTHIFKPALHTNRGLDTLEHRALRLADACGLPAAQSELYHGAFLVERFDRTPTTYGFRRRPMEDLAQAAGLSAGNKYALSAKHAISLLRDRLGDEQAYHFVDQLAFNVHLGNADAHAKNYSVFLDTGELAPLYDTVPLGAFPHYNQDLAMSIAGQQRPAGITTQHWRKLATITGLDPDRVESRAYEIAGAIASYADEFGLAEAIGTAHRQIARVDPPRSSPTPRTETGTDGSRVWVEPHDRDGHPVRGHWRERPKR